MKKQIFFFGVGLLLFGGLLISSDMGTSLFTSLVDIQYETVTLQTNKGDIVIKPLYDEAPTIAKNFVNLAREKKYDGVPFHRVIDGFMIQGGDYENMNGTGGAAYGGGYLADEFSGNLSHVRGAVSMANKGPNTNGSQFFIVQQDASFLDGRHALFGQVIEGMDVVDAIAKTETDLNDAPLTPIVIQKVVLE